MGRPHAPAQVVSRNATQEVRATVGDASGAGPLRVHRGTTAGHRSSGSEPTAPEQAADLRFLSWGGQDLNLRPTDYEFAARVSAPRHPPGQTWRNRGVRGRRGEIVESSERNRRLELLRPDVLLG